jgi:hypothetical protein
MGVCGGNVLCMVFDICTLSPWQVRQMCARDVQVASSVLAKVSFYLRNILHHMHSPADALNLWRVRGRAMPVADLGVSP